MPKSYTVVPVSRWFRADMLRSCAIFLHSRAIFLRTRACWCGSQSKVDLELKIIYDEAYLLSPKLDKIWKF